MTRLQKAVEMYNLTVGHIEALYSDFLNFIQEGRMMARMARKGETEPDALYDRPNEPNGSRRIATTEDNLYQAIDIAHELRTSIEERDALRMFLFPTNAMHDGLPVLKPIERRIQHERKMLQKLTEHASSRRFSFLEGEDREKALAEAKAQQKEWAAQILDNIATLQYVLHERVYDELTS